MRKLSVGNKTNFALFAFIILLIIGVIVVCLTKVLNIDKTIYQINSGTFFYDKENDSIKLEDDATLQAKWDGNYYLKDLVTNEQYNMGATPIAYNTRTTQIDIYGKVYKIDIDGSVQEKIGVTNIKNYNEDSFYKLADRKYLIISNKIYNETETLNTKYYLLIIIDKAGNAFLLNNEIDSKVINPIKIKTSSFEFDVANEKIKYQEKEIDLKKVLGSTNLYQEKDDEQKIVSSDNNTNDNVINNTTNNNTTNNNTTNNNATNTIINVGGNTTNNGNGTENNNGSNNNSNSNSNNGNNSSNDNVNNGNENNGNNSSDSNDSSQDENKTPLAKSVSLRGVTPTSSSLTVQYNVQDPESKYQTVYLLIDGDIGKNIALDKSGNQYVIKDLSPNTEYTIKLMTREYDDEGESVETIEDIINVKTKEIETDLKITKITSSKIYYNLKLDSNYLFDSANLVLYVDGKKEGTQKVNINSSISSNGFSGSFKYKYGSVILIRLEDAQYNDEYISTDISTKIKNY